MKRITDSGKGRIPMTGVLLAGGQSRRMGKDKALLEMDGKSLLLRVREVLEGLFDSILLVGGDPERCRGLGCPAVSDLIPHRGPLGGIYTGLRYAPTEAIFVCGCDFPFLNPDLIRYLAALLPGHDAVVPHTGEFQHPLHAVYSRRCLSSLEQQVKEGKLTLRRAIETLAVREVSEQELRVFDPELLSLTNLNTPEEFDRAAGHEQRNAACIR